MNWLTPEFSGIGNALGYSHHNRMMRKYTQQIIDIEDSLSDICLQIVPAEQFIPVKYKTNILFSMFEMLDIPDSYVESLENADYVLTPCKFVQDIFKPYTKNKPFIVQEGIEKESFPYYKRSNPLKEGKRLRIYWAGAPNPRKGYQYALELLKYVIKYPQIELYIKTTFPKIDPKEIMNGARKILDSRTKLTEKQQQRYERLAEGEGIDKQQELYCKSQAIQYYGEHKNIIFDTRKVDFKELTNLYNQAHIFIFPSMGEGWGLMGCEAMATGLPVIAPAVTGIADYLNKDVGYPIPYGIVEQKLSNYNLTARSYAPELEPFIQKVFEVIDNYDNALVKGRKASEHIHQHFTWDKKAQDLVNIINKIPKRIYEEKKDNKSELLTICIPTYNMCNELDYLLLSIYSQKTTNYNIIISNNNSSDNTLDIINKWHKLINIELYNQNDNIGFDNNIEYVTSKVKTKYFWLMGADDAINYDGIEKVLSKLNEQDLILLDRIDCTEKMQESRYIPWGTDAKEYKFPEESSSYINQCTNLGGIFSYISSLVVNMSYWSSIEDKSWYKGNAYYHMNKLSSMFNSNVKIEYYNEKIVLNRTNDHMIKEKGIVERIIFDLVAIEKIINNIGYEKELKELIKRSHPQQTIEYILSEATEDQKQTINNYIAYYQY